MEKVFIYFIAIALIGLFLYWTRRPPFPGWLAYFLLAGTLSEFFGELLVAKWDGIYYPVRILPEAFHGNIVFDMLAFPAIHVLFYKYSATKSLLDRLKLALALTASFSLFEFFAERYTDLIEYEWWNIALTFGSVFLFLLLIMYLFEWLMRESREKAKE